MKSKTIYAAVSIILLVMSVVVIPVSASDTDTGKITPITFNTFDYGYTGTNDGLITVYVNASGGTDEYKYSIVAVDGLTFNEIPLAKGTAPTNNMITVPCDVSALDASVRYSIQINASMSYGTITVNQTRTAKTLLNVAADTPKTPDIEPITSAPITPASTQATTESPSLSPNETATAISAQDTQTNMKSQKISAAISASFLAALLAGMYLIARHKRANAAIE